MTLDEVLARLEALPADEQEKVRKQVAATVGARKFIPSPGPQTEAWFCKADVLLYGGQGGGGKTGLLCGLALEEQKRSLLMRRQYSDHFGVGGIIDEILKLHGSRDGFNGGSPATLRTSDDRVITFGGAANVGDEQRFQGKARDFLGVDEAAQFAEMQVRFLMGWVRSTEEGARCRTVLASNAPIAGAGDWLIGMFRPWLDLTHPNPAREGELRWYITVPSSKHIGATEDIEVESGQPVQRDGETFIPTSRTFIRAKLSDNPFLGSDYQRTLDALPEPYRSAVRDGNFMAARLDHEFQVIPTQWIREAQQRWTEDPPDHAPMTSLGVDVAQGGQDSTTLAARYDGWFAPLEQVAGVDTPTGNEVAGLILARRRNNCTIVIDMGGGYGGAAKMRLEDNGVDPVIGYKGAEKSRRRTVDQQFGFTNKRSEAYWRLREALDPSQDGGSGIALPDDPELVADLTAPTFEVTSQGIKVLPKEKVIEKLGRSPDKGDAVVMAWFGGPRLATHGNQWRQYSREHGRASRTVNVVQSRQAARRRK